VVIGADGVLKSKGLVNSREHLESLILAAELGHPTLESYLNTGRFDQTAAAING